jgi:glucose-6-phosphate isomerase
MMTNDNDYAHLPTAIARSVDDCLAELQAQRFAQRIQVHDASLWHGNAEEVRQRLGWLHLHETMRPQRDSIVSFAEQVRRDGFTDVVLLGMGGSSLGAEVLNKVFGNAPGSPRLHVLDSTVPGAVRAVAHDIDFAHTLFIVSSKSGGTLEPNLLLDYFFHETGVRTRRHAGSQFVAITDAGSSLETTARERGFRQAFINPSDIGGRYSVLSLFGLVPAALLGIDLARLLDVTSLMAQRCGPTSDPASNPGASLGAFIAGCARAGRDKLTLLTSPRFSSFGLWAEQLVAESTGKEGKGIVPVIGEPLLDVATYADDRAFVYLRLEGDGDCETDTLSESLTAAGFPVLTIVMRDGYSLGGEFYRWEYATAAVGALLGINPFDQPDVQKAKDASTKMLEHFVTHGSLPVSEPSMSLPELLDALGPRDYLAITAYLRQSPEQDGIFAEFRRRTATAHHVSTTLGYGPRFLHSTGQLHKGGPDECVLLQVLSAHPDDVQIPGREYSFGTVADAQALGDLQALQGLNRRVGRILLERDNPAYLSDALNQS